MSVNTNGFNYSSDYQGHSGSLIIILVFLFLGIIAFGSSIKKDVPDNSYNNNYDNSYDSNENYSDDFSDVQDSSENNDVNTDNTDNSDNSEHKIFDYYQP